LKIFTWILTAVIIAVLAGIVIHHPGPVLNPTNTIDPSSMSGPALSPHELVSTKWAYSAERDKLRGRSIVHAELTSDSTANFAFPYSGGSRLTITVRKSHRGDDVYFKISKGQFTCETATCQGALNVDGAVHSLTLTAADDDSADMIFAVDAKTVIDLLSHGKKIIVELPFYEEGQVQFEFSTPINLHWPPLATELNNYE